MKHDFNEMIITILIQDKKQMMIYLYNNSRR